MIDLEQITHLKLDHNLWDADKGRSETKVLNNIGREQADARETLKRPVRSIPRYLHPGQDETLAPELPDFPFMESRPMGGTGSLHVGGQPRSLPFLQAGRVGQGERRPAPRSPDLAPSPRTLSILLTQPPYACKIEHVACLFGSVEHHKRYGGLHMESVGKYECTKCDYIYVPEHGDASQSVHADTPFDELPAGWACPKCGANKDDFQEMDDRQG